jgi:16S rRNA (cytosine1402-N4)-methyltransferase
MEFHEPVLLKETLDYLGVKKEKKYIDCTLGDGGHTLAILKEGGIVLGLDYNSSSLNRAVQRIERASLEKNFLGVVGNFKDLEKIANRHEFTDVDGIIYDLGYSSSHLESGIGLSFQKDETLDMRLDNELGVTASDLVNTLSEVQLTQLFREYGEEALSKQFARAIVESRRLKKIESTKDLADLIVGAAPPGYERGRIHPATRVFQALRILVNDELENLRTSLPQAAHLLRLPGGRMVVISFHSLEDRMAKELGQNVRPGINVKSLTSKPITPSSEEKRANIRARSAKMRVYERIQ